MRLDFSNTQRIRYIRILICLSLLCIVAISYKLWLNERQYPLAPFFDFIPVLHSPFDWMQLAVVAGLLIAIVFSSNAVFSRAFFAAFLLLALCDQNRLQPYYSMFAFMLLLLSLRKNSERDEREKFVLNALRLILIGTYLWSGIHKINLHFIDRLYPFFARSEFSMPGFEPQDYIRKYVVLIIPFTELFIAIGLMLNRTRRLALHLVVAMHFAVMVFLSPFGFGWNLVVIPWNAALLLINILLFWKVEAIPLVELWNPDKSIVKALVILLFFIMPIFNLFGWWDHYLSSSLYSFKTPYGKIYVDESLRKNLPEYFEQYFFSDEKGEFIETTYWAMGELNVTTYPEPRVYEKMKEFICQYDSRDTCHAELLLYH